jgi:hypothetical protein
MRPTFTPFSVWLRGSFYALSFYDEQGRDIHDLDRAAEEAERQFGQDWREVSNGQEGTPRDEWIERRKHTR